MNEILVNAHTQASNSQLSLAEEAPEIQTQSFDDVYNAVETLDKLRIPSPPEVKTLGDLRFESASVVEVPSIGRLHLTDWTQRRLGSMIGVKWHKFFDPMDPDIVSAAIHSHVEGLGSSSPNIRLVSRELMDHEVVEHGTDSLLRGVVSPSYSEFRDIQALDRLRTVMGDLLDTEWAFSSVSLIDDSSHFNMIFTEPFRLIDGSDDWAYVGMRLRNSEVGAHSWTGSVRVLRIVCVNGMMAPLAEGHHFRFIHKGLKLERIDGSIEEALDQCYGVVSTLPQLMQRLLEARLSKPHEQLQSFMERAGLSIAMREAVLQAYDTEEMEDHTAYRAVQAITSLSPMLRNNPNRQQHLEQIASNFARQYLDN